MKKPTGPRRPWQRMALSILGVSIIAGVWERAVAHLYSLPEYSITAFTSLTTNTFYSVTVIVVFMVSGKMFMDWRNSTSSVVNQVHEVISNTEKKMSPKDFDDPSIP